MEKKIKILTGLLAISLVLNLYSILRLGKIENMLSYSNHDHRMMEMFKNDIHGLYRKIDEIKQESKWIASKEFKPNEGASSPEEIHLELDVSFKELEEDAKVLLLYRAIAEGEGWTELSANKVGRNLFTAPLILSPEEEYEYQLVAEGSTVKVEEINRIPVAYYRPTPLTISGAGGSHSNNRWHQFQVSFSQNTPVLFNFYRVKDVKARIYFGDKFTTFKLEKRNIGHRYEWSLEMVPEDLDGEITAVILEIQYADGSLEEENFTAEVLEMKANMLR
ncbi:MAG: hypothetical protein JJT76_07095 [Clostridiaceae bacterium]|nr:hypothetical protein [Clostridiaceae bacterium]